MKIYLSILLAFITTITLFAQQPVFNVVEDYNYWQLEKGKKAFVYADKAYIREFPSYNSTLLDSVFVGQEVTIESQGYNTTKIKGIEAPWHKISYRSENKVKQGYIWIGLLALGQHINSEGVKFTHGFDKYISSTEEESGYFLASLKAVDKKNNLLSTFATRFNISEQVFNESKVLTNMGLDGIQSIYRISFSGEACGIPTNYYYIAWNGQKFIEMPMRYTVADAGIYYYEEKILFPNEHNLEANTIYKDSEEGEVIDENAAVYKYKTKNKREKYLWDGKSFSLLNSSK